MRRAALWGAIGAAGVAVTAAATSLPALAQDAPTVAITADGNAFGSLAFAPAAVTATVGQRLEWRNTDGLARHTVTEDHGLFDLAGEDAAGFRPGTTVELSAFAGTTGYRCRLHPGRMSGVIRVPVVTSLGPRYKAPATPARTKAGKARRAERRKNFQRRLTLTWAAIEPADGRAYDVEVRRGSGPWKPLLTRTLDTTITIASGKRGTTSQIRARMRLEADETQGTAWSPAVRVTP